MLNSTSWGFVQINPAQNPLLVSSGPLLSVISILLIIIGIISYYRKVSPI